MAPSIIRDAGYTLRELPQRVGPAVGTATHAAVAHTMLNKIATGESANQTETEQAGLEALGESIAEGVEFDATSPNLNTAQRQVVRQYRVFRLHLERDLKPRQVERRIEKLTKRGNTLSGQPDVVDGGVIDLKTGVAHRSCLQQLGAYSLLLRADGLEVTDCTEDYIRRVALDKEQPPPEQIGYNVELAERVAGSIILDIERRFEAFEQSGDQFEFMANTGSQLCSDRWCVAFRTPFCPESANK